MKVLVTGGAGFIGSTLVEEAVRRGADVTAIDRISDYYSPELKRQRFERLAGLGATCLELAIHDEQAQKLAQEADVVFHLAAQAGVRASWKDEFAIYVRDNIEATQLLLEAARVGGSKLVYASSSSVYGKAQAYPVREDQVTVPHSPYGVTKLAAENLCRLYSANFGVPTISLRFFTVYGPGQRPDMAMHRLVEAALKGDEFPVFGDGSQVRDFTYVDDVVAAVWSAGEQPTEPGTVVNVAGGESATLNDVIDDVERITGHEVRRRPMAFQAGDVQRTGGSTDKIREVLGWAPKVDRDQGLRAQVAWHRENSDLLTRAKNDA